MDLTFRPEQTRRLLADSFRNGIAIVQSGRVGVPLDEKFVFTSTAAWASVRPNVGGRIMNESITFFNVSFVRRLKRLEAREECLRMVLACARYRRKTGAYPERLEALVPEFLDATPHDPYSGAPSIFTENGRSSGRSARICGTTAEQRARLTAVPAHSTKQMRSPRWIWLIRFLRPDMRRRRRISRRIGKSGSGAS